MPVLDVVARQGARLGGAGRTGDTASTGARPLVLSAVFAALAVAVAGLVPAVALSMLGWILGGDETSGAGAVRTGAVLWLAGHGGAPVVDGTTVSLVPLLVPALLVLLGVQAARWALSTSATPGSRAALGAVGVGAATYASAVGVVGWVVHGSHVPGAVDVDVARAAGLTLLGGLVLLGAVVAPTTDAWAAAGSRSAAEVGDVARGIAGALVVPLAGSALVLVTVLGVHADRVLSVGGELAPGVGGAVVLALLCLATLPNAVLWTLSYLVGPGFAVGAGTVVAPGGVLVGALPAYPLLGALPAPGEPPGWVSALTALPVLAGFVGGVVSARTPAPHRAPGGWARTVLCGGAVGVGAGLLLATLMALSGGAVGPGTMGDTGPLPAAAGLLVATLTVSAAAGAVARRLVADRAGGPRGTGWPSIRGLRSALPARIFRPFGSPSDRNVGTSRLGRSRH